jgi:hypothetical protein
MAKRSEIAAMLAAVEAGELTASEASAALKKAAPAPSIRTGKHGKGNVSVYGLGRFPATNYPATWVTLAELMPRILAHIVENADELSFNGERDEVIARIFALVGDTPADESGDETEEVE